LNIIIQYQISFLQTSSENNSKYAEQSAVGTLAAFLWIGQETQTASPEKNNSPRNPAFKTRQSVPNAASALLFTVPERHFRPLPVPAPHIATPKPFADLRFGSLSPTPLNAAFPRFYQ